MTMKDCTSIKEAWESFLSEVPIPIDNLGSYKAVFYAGVYAIAMMQIEMADENVDESTFDEFMTRTINEIMAFFQEKH